MAACYQEYIQILKIHTHFFPFWGKRACFFFFGCLQHFCFSMLLLFSDVFGQNFVAHVQSTAHFSFWQLAHQPPSDLRGRPLQSDLSNRTSPIGPFRASSEDAVFVRCSRVEIAAARIAALPELVLLACCFGCSLQLRRRFCSNAARKVSSVTKYKKSIGKRTIAKLF